MSTNKYILIDEITSLLNDCDITLLEAIYNAIRNIRERSFEHELQRRNKKYH